MHDLYKKHKKRLFVSLHTMKNREEVRLKYMRLMLVAAVLIAALAIAGCGGGGGGSAVTGGTGVLTTLSTDVGEGSVTPKSRDSIDTTLPNATVEVFDFSTGTKIATSTTGADGKVQISLPAGKTVVVIVTGTRDSKPYRLSLIIPSTTEAKTEYTVSPATTIAAEAIAQKHYAQNEVLDEKTWNDAVTAAQTYIDANSDPDMSVGGGVIEADKAFGADGSLGAALADVIASIPDEIDSDLIKAKNAIMQIKQAGVPFETLLDDEFADIADVAQATGDAIDNTNLEVYAEKYCDMARRVADLIMPALNDGFIMSTQLTGVEGHYSIFDLEVGNAYVVTQNNDGIWIEEALSGQEAGKVKITYVDDATTYVLRGTPNSDSSKWTIVQTSSADASLNYTVVVDDDSTPSLSVSIQDKDITTPLTLNGSISFVGPSGGPYTSINISGNLSSAELTASGTVTLKFDELDLGRVDDRSNYPYEIDIALTSGRFSAGTVTATAKGSFSMVFENIIRGVSPSYAEITLTNAQLSATVDGHTTSVSGSGVVKTSYVMDDEYPELLPTEFTINNFSASIENGQVTATGSLSVKCIAPEEYKSGIVGNVIPQSVTLTGTFTNKHNGTTLTGTLTGVWENAADYVSLDTAEGTVTVNGSLKRSGYEDFSVDLAVVADGEGTATLTINTLGWKNVNIEGTGTFTFDADGELATAELTVTNQDNVQIALDNDYNGTVTIDGTEIGTITKNGNAAQVHFTDDTDEYLFGVPGVD